MKSSSQPLQRYRFLVVDDNVTITNLVSLKMLKAGYECDIAINGEEGLFKIKQNEYDMIMSDISMPCMDGLELLKKIKKYRPLLPVLIITGHATIENAVKALRLGAINFITKPINFDEIFSTINKVLDIQLKNRALRLTKKNLLLEKSLYSFPTGELYVSELAGFLIETLENMNFFEPAHSKAIMMALYEILINAVEHGNLKLPSEIKFTGENGFVEFNKLKQSRILDPSYALKKVTVEVNLTQYEASFTITDEGNGFDYNNLPDPTVEENMEKPHGRGIFLARQMFDEVLFNKKGNSVTVVLRNKLH